MKIPFKVRELFYGKLWKDHLLTGFFSVPELLPNVTQSRGLKWVQQQYHGKIAEAPSALGGRLRCQLMTPTFF